MPSLRVGTYQVRAELAGFMTFVVEDIRLSAGASSSLDFTLAISGIQETVTAVGKTDIIDAGNSSLASKISPEQIQNLPLVGRNWVDLAALVPGARGNPGEVRTGASSTDMANYQVDGVDVTAQGIGGTSMSYSQEAVAEFEVVTNRYSAEYGRVASAGVRVVTKSGTNNFHGAGFGFFRDDKLNAKDFVTGTVTPLNQQQFGGTIGGPIALNRAQFFFSYERQKSNAMIRPNTGLPQFDVDQEAGSAASLVTGRVDLQATQAHRLFVRMGYNNRTALSNNGGGRISESATNDLFTTGWDVGIGWTWVVSNTLVNEVSAGSPWISNDLVPHSLEPRLTFPAVIMGTASNAPQWYSWRTLTFSDSITWFVPNWHGEHKIKSGVLVGQGRILGELPRMGKAFPQFNFPSNPSDFNNPATYPKPTSVSQAFGDFNRKVLNPFYGVYFQDDWRLGAKLTVNLGVRYDVETGAFNTDMPNLFESQPRTVDKNNFAPRLGFAFDPTGEGRLVVRAGGGRYFDRILLNVSTSGPESMKRYNVTNNNPSFSDPWGGRTEQQILAQLPPRDVSFMQGGYQTHHQDQYSIGFAQQLAERGSFQIDYVRARGRFLPMSRRMNYFQDPNTLLPLNPSVYGRPFPTYGNITRLESTGRSAYDGIQTAFVWRRGPNSPFDVNVSYTLSWTKTSADVDRFGFVNHPFNVDGEYATSLSDQRHRMVASVRSSLPWDLAVSGIFLVGSPNPINITTSLDPFRLGYTGRWLDASGNTLAKNSERTGKWDSKLDIRVMKTIRAHKVRVDGIVDALNLLNQKNYDPRQYGNVYGTTRYLQPGSSTNLFYQPRSVQLGFRVSY
jgi:hypothetical protein